MSARAQRAREPSETEVILCAFEAFGGRKRNRAREAAIRVGDVVVLPVSFARLRPAVRALVRRGPRAILLCGEHGGARAIHVEQVARNLVHARVPDNDGRTPRGPVRRGGPEVLRATWPARAVLRAVKRAGVAARPSRDAGDYACNAALYLALDEAARRRARIAIGFLHVPAGRGRMRLGEIARGIRAAIRLLEKL